MLHPPTLVQILASIILEEELLTEEAKVVDLRIIFVIFVVETELIDILLEIVLNQNILELLHQCVRSVENQAILL